jgi:exodeoxyribonuclease VII large subunit
MGAAPCGRQFMSRELGASAPLAWTVGALCRAIADALMARFNPVTVRGEIAGFSRAASGHCYFVLKDDAGQLRCAMFRRAASLLESLPREGEQVELRGRLALYEPRGELQLVVESLRRVGQGQLFEQFLRRKASLEAEGLFEAARKQALPLQPRAIGLVTSLGAAALHDVATVLQRRVPHIPVRLAPASVQGAQAPQELMRALQALSQPMPDGLPAVDVILLVRGGGSLEDLWAFNDEALARAVAHCRVPVVSGVGHETDFTLVDFVADLRAPTPTAAAELCARARRDWLSELDQLERAWAGALGRRLDTLAQRLDRSAQRLGRPSAAVADQQLRLARLADRLQHGCSQSCRRHDQTVQQLTERFGQAFVQGQQRQVERLQHAGLRLRLLDPALVLQRGYAWLEDSQGRTISRAAPLQAGQQLRATLADGQAELQVQSSSQTAGQS